MRIKSDDLDVGQYFTDITVDECNSKQTLTFDVLTQGALKAEGLLLEIVTKGKANVGETIPILGVFKNVGEKEIQGQFKGHVTKDGKIIELLESEKYNVPVSGIYNFNFYFTPKEAGKYIINGRVFYSGKRTFETSSTLDVYSNGFSFKSILVPAIYVFLIFFILILIFKIRKERRTYSNKLKNLR